MKQKFKKNIHLDIFKTWSDNFVLWEQPDIIYFFRFEFFTKNIKICYTYIKARHFQESFLFVQAYFQHCHRISSNMEDDI